MNAPTHYDSKRWKHMLQRQAALAGENYRLLDIALREIEDLKARLAKWEVA